MIRRVEYGSMCIDIEMVVYEFLFASAFYSFLDRNPRFVSIQNQQGQTGVLYFLTSVACFTSHVEITCKFDSIGGYYETKSYTQIFCYGSFALNDRN